MHWGPRESVRGKTVHEVYGKVVCDCQGFGCGVVCGPGAHAMLCKAAAQPGTCFTFCVQARLVCSQVHWLKEL